MPWKCKPELATEKERICKHCGKMKSIHEFSLKGRFYRQYVCKVCWKIAYPSQNNYVKKGYTSNRDLEEYAKRWNKANPTQWTNFEVLKAIMTQP